MLPDARYYKPSPDKFRALVYSLMDDAPMNQQEIADRLGVSRRSLGYWMSGKVSVPYSIWFTICALRDQTR